MKIQETLIVFRQVQALATRMSHQSRRVALAKASKMLKK